MRNLVIGLALSSIACQSTDSSLGDLPGDGGTSDTDPGGDGLDGATDDAATDEGTGLDPACTAEGASVSAFFTVDFGTFPIPDPNLSRILDIPCVVAEISIGGGDATTTMSCTADDQAHAVMLTHRIPTAVSPDWAVDDDVLLSVDLLGTDFLELHDITASLRSPEGDLLFAGVGDLAAVDGSGSVFFGIPNDHPTASVLSPLTVEPDQDFCDVPSETDGPIAVVYSLPGESTRLVGTVSSGMEAGDRTYVIEQERAHLTPENDHVAFGLQLSVLATK